MLESEFLAACRRETSEVSDGTLVSTVACIIKPIRWQNYTLKLPKSGKIALSDRLLGVRKKS
jgi:hypothetical protein